MSDKEIFFEVSYEDLDALLEKLKNPRQKFGDWRISNTLYWKMTFPAQKETIVEHEYEPGTGHPWTIPYEEGFEKDFKQRIARLSEEHNAEDCLDETTKRAVENSVKRAVSRAQLERTNRRVKLRLVKEKPSQFVSVCFPGKPEKISPTTYEFVQKDFAPPDKLVVYFYNVDAEIK